MSCAYLNAVDGSGNRSCGPVVFALQVYLIGARHSPHFRTSPDATALRATGIYDDETVAEVRYMQSLLGFADPDDLDGNCGPATRSRLRERTGADLDAIFASMDGHGRYAQADGTMFEGTWEQLAAA